MSISHLYKQGCIKQSIFALMFLLICVPFSYADTPVYKQAVTQPSVAFFSGNQDIPIMPGLAEIEARSFSYDKPEGEITEVVALVESVSEEQVLYYYDVTLPQFGWNKVIDAGSGHFFRNGEYLDLSFETDGEQSFVKIMIRPVR